MIIVLLVGVAFFAYTMGSLNSLIVEYYQTRDEENRMTEFNIWLNSLEALHGDVPKNLKNQIKRHFMYYFSTDKNKQMAKSYWKNRNIEYLVSVDQEYLKELPEEIVKKVVKLLYNNFLESFDYFLGKSDFAYKLVFHLQPRQLF